MNNLLPTRWNGQFDPYTKLNAEYALENYYGQDPEDYPFRDTGLAQIQALKDRIVKLESFCANFILTGWET